MFALAEKVKIMLKVAVAIIALIFSACIFTPEEPQPPQPGERFTDRFNLDEIVAGTLAEFSFNNYRELFIISNDLYIDIDRRAHSSERFISRLNSINNASIVFSAWSAEQGGDFVSMDAPTTLRVRNFRISRKLPSGEIEERTGDVRITISWNDGMRWQIIRWEELGDSYSIFHPDDLGN